MVSAVEWRWRAAHGAAVGLLKQAANARTGRRKQPARRGFSAVPTRLSAFGRFIPMAGGRVAQIANDYRLKPGLRTSASTRAHVRG